jgi:alpha-L-fucosidase
LKKWPRGGRSTVTAGFGLRGILDKPKQEFFCFYNRAIERDKEVVITYKDCDLASGSGVVDLELGRMDRLTNYEWITDATIDNGQGWGYLNDTPYKTTRKVVHYLVDNVSKNGHLLLNVGSKPDGTLPEEAQELLRRIGRWLAVNGEAIYGTSNRITYGEDLAQIKKAGAFNGDEKPAYSRKDERFTIKGDALYPIVMDWAGEYAVIETLKDLDEIQSIKYWGWIRNWSGD